MPGNEKERGRWCILATQRIASRNTTNPTDERVMSIAKSTSNTGKLVSFTMDHKSFRVFPEIMWES